MKYWIKLKDNEKILIDEESYIGLSHGLFIENLKFTSRNGMEMVIPLNYIKLWYSIKEPKAK